MEKSNAVVLITNPEQPEEILTRIPASVRPVPVCFNKFMNARLFRNLAGREAAVSYDGLEHPMCHEHVSHVVRMAMVVVDDPVNADFP